GACRDVRAGRDVVLPVSARAAVPMMARGRVMEESFNREIEFAGVQVHPGELVIADGSGIVIIPRAKEEEVVREAEAVTATEARMAEGIREGMSVLEVLERLGYEQMLNKKEYRRRKMDALVEEFKKLSVALVSDALDRL